VWDYLTIILDYFNHNHYMGLYIVIAVVVILFLWFIGTYNRLISAKNAADNSWADIDVQLKRRYDLIPNLVETVKGYAGHEKTLFENVTKARTAAMGAQTPADHAAAEDALSGTLKTLFAVAENYPDLKASQNFMELQSELRDTEDKIQASRRFYNANVRDWNTLIQQFPTNMVANPMKFTARQFFEVADNTQRAAPKVSF
jgi:LemA protein